MSGLIRAGLPDSGPLGAPLPFSIETRRRSGLGRVSRPARDSLGHADGAACVRAPPRITGRRIVAGAGARLPCPAPRHEPSPEYPLMSDLTSALAAIRFQRLPSGAAVAAGPTGRACELLRNGGHARPRRAA